MRSGRVRANRHNPSRLRRTQLRVIRIWVALDLANDMMLIYEIEGVPRKAITYDFASTGRADLVAHLKVAAKYPLIGRSGSCSHGSVRELSVVGRFTCSEAASRRWCP
jgi:hypothetical protein